MTPRAFKLSVVVPARNAATTISATLATLRANDLAAPLELIVVDDASTDATASIAGRYADTVIRLRGEQMGLAYARNRGAELARGEVVVFVNADVCVRPDTLGRLLAVFGDSSVDAIVAGHAPADAGDNFASRYWNSLRHFGEQRYHGNAGDLASGCSAVRRSALARAGMYDEWRFRTVSVEGLELAQRFHQAGMKVLSARHIPVAHKRTWSVLKVYRETWDRSRMVARSLGYAGARNAVPSDVVFTLSRAMPSALAVVSIVALSGAFVPAPWYLAKVGAVFGSILVANLPLYRFYLKNFGPLFAVAAVPVHLGAQGVAAAALCTGWVLRDTLGDKSPDAATQAYAEVGLKTWPPVPRRP